MRGVIILGLLVLVGFVVLAIGYSAEQASLRQQADRARLLSQDFAKTLKSQLIAAIKADGPASAIGVCQHISPLVSAQFSKGDMSIGRTALKLRNPANAPDAWERSILDKFEMEIAKGASPAGLERYGFFAQKDGSKTFRYMKAIPVGQPCLACHGTNLSPEVQTALEAQYPDDQATGFELGALRGAFTISKEMPKL